MPNEITFPFRRSRHSRRCHPAGFRLGTTAGPAQLPPAHHRTAGPDDRHDAVARGRQPQAAGRLTIQLRGDGPVSLLVIDCSESLNVRCMAQVVDETIGNAAPLVELLGHGQLLLSLDMDSMKEPYQSVVSLSGHTIAEANTISPSRNSWHPAFGGHTAGCCRPVPPESRRPTTRTPMAGRASKLSLPQSGR